MSYIYLSEAGEVCSAASYRHLPTANLPFVLSLSKLNQTVNKYSCGYNGKESYPDSQFGTTLKPLTPNPIEAKSTSSPADSHAQTSVAPAVARESQANTPDYGQKCGEWFAKFDPATSSWRTRQCSLFEDTQPLPVIWPRWGMIRNGYAWELTMPSGIKEIRARITNAKESGYLVRFPTPTVSGNYNRKGCSKTSGDGLATYVRRFPGQQRRNSPPLNIQVGGQLNPDWVEWLMGWPVGWTGQSLKSVDYLRRSETKPDLKPSETDSAQQQPPSPGDCFEEWLQLNSKSLWI